MLIRWKVDSDVAAGLLSRWPVFMRQAGLDGPWEFVCRNDLIETLAAIRGVGPEMSVSSVMRCGLRPRHFQPALVHKLNEAVKQITLEHHAADEQLVNHSVDR